MSRNSKENQRGQPESCPIEPLVPDSPSQVRVIEHHRIHPSVFGTFFQGQMGVELGSQERVLTVACCTIPERLRFGENEMHRLFSAGSVTGDTRILLNMQLPMRKQPVLFFELLQGQVLGGWSVSGSVASQAAFVGHGTGYRSIRHAARRDEVMWRVAIGAAKCRIDHLDVDARLYSLRDLVEVDGRGNHHSAMTVNTVGHASAGACVRKLAETVRVARGAVQGGVYGMGELHWIDRGVPGLVTLHAGRALIAVLSHTRGHKPYRAGEQQNERANGSHGWLFGSSSALPSVFPLSAGGLEPGTLSSRGLVENLREAT